MSARMRSPGARDRGRALYLEHCALCHGERADGHGTRREGLSSAPVDFTRPEWMADRTPADVYRSIRDGVPSRSMPAWRALGEESLWDLTAYVIAVSEEGP